MAAKTRHKNCAVKIQHCPISSTFDSEHRKMRAKQQHVCKEMNQYIQSMPTGSGF